MNHLSRIVKCSTKNKTWCYRQGYYRIPPKKNNKIFNYGQWFNKTKKPLNRAIREKKIKYYLQQF